MTIIVKSEGLVFVRSMAPPRNDVPVFTEAFTTVLFTVGILLVSTSGLNFRIAYLALHAIRAVLLTICSVRAVSSTLVSGAR
jgi:hypothetical protein